MSARKTALLNLRIEPAIKDALREAARREHRSIANMVEVLTRRYCDDAGIVITEKKPEGTVDAMPKRGQPRRVSQRRSRYLGTD